MQGSYCLLLNCFRNWLLSRKIKLNLLAPTNNFKEMFKCSQNNFSVALYFIKLTHTIPEMLVFGRTSADIFAHCHERWMIMYEIKLKSQKIMDANLQLIIFGANPV